MPIAPSTYCVHAGHKADPALCPARAHQDAVLREEFQRVWDENRQVYGAR